MSKVNTFLEARLTRDLMYRSATSSTGGMYFNESSAAFDGLNTRSEFTFDSAYDNFKIQRERINNWEELRAKRVQQLQSQGIQNV